MAKTEKDGRMSAGACLNLGREVTRMACGIAYAVRAVERGDSSQLGVGLATAIRFSGGIKDLLPAGEKTAARIRNAGRSIEKTVAAAARKGKRLTGKESAGMLGKLREMGRMAEELFSKGAGRCP